MKPDRLRLGELLALAGAVVLGVCTFLPWYHTRSGSLTAWNGFVFIDLLIVVDVLLVLALVAATVTERTPALPVASATWTILVGLITSLAIALGMLDRPAHATSLAAASAISLVAALATLAGGWLSLRDERTSLYPPVEPEPRRPAVG